MAFELNLDFVNILDATFNAGTQLIPALRGEPGIGKSNTIEDLANLWNTKVFVIQCNEIAEKADLTGVRTIEDPANPGTFKQIFFPHFKVAEAIEYALAHPEENPILFMDEINRTTPDVTNSMLSFATSRTSAGIKMPDNLRIIVAMNPSGNISMIDEAGLTRLITFDVQPSLNEFMRKNPNLHPVIADILPANPHLLVSRAQQVDINDYLSDEDTQTFANPRTITALSNTLNAIGDEMITKMKNMQSYTGTNRMSLLREFINSHIGENELSDMIFERLSNYQPSRSKHNFDKPETFDEFKSLTEQNYKEAVNFLESKGDTKNTIMYLLTTNDLPLPTSVQLLSAINAHGTKDPFTGDLEESQTLKELVASGQISQHMVSELTSRNAFSGTAIEGKWGSIASVGLA